MEKILVELRDYFSQNCRGQEIDHLMYSGFSEKEYKAYKEGIADAYKEIVSCIGECIENHRAKKKKFYKEHLKEFQEAFEETFPDMPFHFTLAEVEE